MDDVTPSKPSSMRSDQGAGPITVLRMLYEQVRPISLRMGGGLVFIILSTLSNLIQPLATGHVLGALSRRQDLSDAIMPLVAALVAAIAFGYLGNYLLLGSTESLIEGLRTRVARRSLSLTVGEMARQNPGELMSRIMSDASEVRVLLMAFATQVIAGVITIIGAVGAMIVIDVFLLTVTVCAAILPGSLLLLVVPRVKTWTKHRQRRLGALGKELERILGNFTMVKANGAEPQEAATLQERTAQVKDAGVRVAVWSSLSTALSITTMQVTFIAVLATGGLLVDQGRMTVPSLVAFLMYASQLSAPVLGLTRAANAFQAGQASLERTAEVDAMTREAGSVALEVHEIRSPDRADGARRAPGAEPASTPLSERFVVEFSDVVFHYPDQEEPALRGLELCLSDRGVTALVGPSGCGKSTVLRLACGLYPIDSGQLSIAGRPIEEWDLRSLRRRIAYVEQEAPVLEGTLRDNLLYGLTDGSVDDETIYRTLELVSLRDRFTSLDAPVGYRGQTLSGGERQRVAVARGLLRSPNILLLDESTSALDATTEQQVVNGLRSVSTSLGIVMIAHRLMTIVDADRIVVLEDGVVRAAGTHDELLEVDDLYRRLVADSTQQDLQGVGS